MLTLVVKKPAWLYRYRHADSNTLEADLRQILHCKVLLLLIGRRDICKILVVSQRDCTVSSRPYTRAFSSLQSTNGFRERVLYQ